MRAGANSGVLTAVLLLLPLLLAGKCGGGDGSGGSSLVVDQTSFDERCAPLADVRGFPPGYDFVPQPAGPAPLRVLAATATQSNLIPLAVEETPFQLPAGSVNFLLPPDSDGDGNIEFFKSIDDVIVTSSELALVTVSGNVEAVLFVEPSLVAAREAEVSVPLGFDPAGFAPFPGLPAPGSSRLQTGITTSVCVDAGPDALDSRGDRLEDAIPSLFWCDGPGTFPASFTSGAALSGGRLFATTSNVGLDPGAEDTQFLPASVAVYDIDPAVDPIAVSPATDTADGRPYILTSGFNATHVSPYTTPAGRRFVLVTLSGAIGIRADDPNTDEIESGALPITDGAIDVIDVDAGQLVATIPLADANPAFDGVAIDPSGRLALFGDLNARHLYGVDLSLLESLGAAVPGDPPVQLDGAVVFDGRNPLVIPALEGGAPLASCPGQVSGVAFDDTGTAVYALESCDGAVAAFRVDLTGDPSLAELRMRGVVYLSTSPATAPLRADTVDQLRRPTRLKVRPGRPGIDYQGPDVFFLITDPESLLCGVRIDSP